MSSTCAYMNPEQRSALLARLPRKAKLPRQCEHIKANGEFCGSPALRGRHHCYFHLTHLGRKIRAERARERARLQSFDAGATVLELPPFEDANAIQVSLMQVVDAILHNQIDSKRAGLVLYALQTASSNLANGADFSLAQASTVAGRYDDFEQDFQLDDEAVELKTEEGTAAPEETEHAAELARIEELAQAYERVAVAKEQAEQRIKAGNEAGEDTEAQEQALAAVEGSTFHCHPVEQLMCKMFGPRARDCDPGPSVARNERDATSQRRELGTAHAMELKKAA